MIFLQVNIKLNKDFERCMESLRKKYGEDFEKIVGLHETQLDFSDFIDNFVDKDTVACSHQGYCYSTF